MPQEEVDGFCGVGGALQGGGEEDVADFEGEMFWCDAHQGEVAYDDVIGGREDGEVEWVGRGCFRGYGVAECGEVAVWSVVHVVPDAGGVGVVSANGCVESFGMVWVEGFEGDCASAEDCFCREGGWRKGNWFS